jgi:hypothetical protein
VCSFVKALIKAFPAREIDLKTQYNKFLLLVRFDQELALTKMFAALDPFRSMVADRNEALFTTEIRKINDPIVSEMKIDVVWTNATLPQKTMIWKFTEQLFTISTTFDAARKGSSSETLALVDKVLRSFSPDDFKNGRKPDLAAVMSSVMAEMGMKPSDDEKAKLDKFCRETLPKEMDDVMKMIKRKKHGKMTPQDLQQIQQLIIAKTIGVGSN